MIRLQGSADWEGLWESLMECADRMNLKSLRLSVNAPSLHEGYHAHWHCLEDEMNPSLWRAEVPLTAQGQTVGRLEIIGQRNHSSVWSTIAALADYFDHGLDAAVSQVFLTSQSTPPACPKPVPQVLA